MSNIFSIFKVVPRVHKLAIKSLFFDKCGTKSFDVSQFPQKYVLQNRKTKMIEQCYSINFGTSKIQIYSHKKRDIIAVSLINQFTDNYQDCYKFH